MEQKWNIVKNKTCFKIPNRPTYIDLFVTNSTHSFHNTMTRSAGLPDSHKIIITVLKSSFIKLKTREMYCRGYKNFSTNSLGEVLALSLGCISKSFDSFEDSFIKNLNRHEPIEKKLIRECEVSCMTKALRKEIMENCKLENKYLKNKTYQNFNIYKNQKNSAGYKLYKKGKKILKLIHVK